MAHREFARKARALPVVVFLLTFLLIFGSLSLLSVNQEKDERLRAVYVAESTVSRVTAQLNRYLTESHFVKKYMESGHALSDEEFAVISSNMQDDSSVIKAHELAKDGTVSQIYPMAGNEAAIGLNMLENPARKKEATLAKDSGVYTIAGPYELVQGGTGALLFDPIYLKGPSGQRTFWGFSILVLQWDEFIGEIELNKMEEAGYQYQIWKKDPYTDEKVVIAQSGDFVDSNTLEVACNVPNDVWYFDIVPKSGWFTERQLGLGIFISTITGLLAAFVCWQIQTRRQRDVQHEAALEKSVQEARAANEAKTRFLFNMSHDIRTPMNAIIGFSELLEKHIDEKDKVLDYTEKIRASSGFLLSLINYVLEMARIESGKAVLRKEHGNVAVLMKTLEDVFEPTAQQKHLTCTYTTDIRHSDVICDSTKVREILLNVISNAVKYTPEGGHIAVSVKELPSEKEGTGHYVFTVQDDGIGMSEEYLPHIFEEFTREHTSTESKVTGTGLGLPIVRALVEWMQGTIDVRSSLGKGTTMTVTLDFQLAEPGQDSNVEPDAEQDAADLSGCSILLAEDNDLNAEIAMTILEEKGLRVERAADGALCVEMLKKHPVGYYDVILMDIQMPRMDGYQAAQLIRNLPDDRRKTPIIAMTANAFEEDRQKALAVGMNDHLAKPINVEGLFRALRKVLK